MTACLTTETALSEELAKNCDRLLNLNKDRESKQVNEFYRLPFANANKKRIKV